MKKVALGFWTAALLFAGFTLQAQDIRFPVRYHRFLRSSHGELIFGETGIEYKTADAKHARVWKYEDIQQLGMLSPREVSILTYEDSKWKLGKDRLYRFDITEGEIAPSLWTALQEKLTRPLVSAVIPPGITPKFTIAVKHRHGFGGTQGTLEISDQYLIYRTEAHGDSRIWRYEDISSIGTTGPYELRLTSVERVQGEFGDERNFVFSLKRRLAPEVYDYIWWKINGPQISPALKK